MSGTFGSRSSTEEGGGMMAEPVSQYIQPVAVTFKLTGNKASFGT